MHHVVSDDTLGIYSDQIKFAGTGFDGNTRLLFGMDVMMAFRSVVLPLDVAPATTKGTP